MPAFDGTGPRGMGPKTGRQMGSCCMGFGMRRGLVGGRGLGRYFGWGQQTQDKDQQKQALQDYKKALQEELEDLDKELEKVNNEE